MKIICSCENVIIDQTDFLNYKGYFISDQQWFNFWDAIDQAIEDTSKSPKEKEKACMELRQQYPFKQAWECRQCGKLYLDNSENKLTAYSPDSKVYNRILDHE